MIDVVGIGDDGWDGLPPASRELVEAAATVVGGRRQLALLPDRPGQHRLPLPCPLRERLPGLVEEHRDGGLVVLASGDPLRSGIGTTLVELLGPERVRVHPALSSETLARARMGWPAEETAVVTVVGRDLARVRPHLAPRRRMVVLCSDGRTPAALAALLVDSGHGSSRMTAWWHLGGPAEGTRSAVAAAWPPEPCPDLVLVCVEVAEDRAAGAGDGRGDPAVTEPGVAAPRPPSEGRGPAPGRPSEAFDHDGQITRPEARAAALARLRPFPGGVLWDLGAGSGAVGIEWCLAAPGARAVCVERDPARADRVRRNAERHGVGAAVTVVTGTVPGFLDGPGSQCRTGPRTQREHRGDAPADDAPDAVFAGGGLTEPVLARCRGLLRPGGRLVAHAVTVETEALLLAAQAGHGGAVVRLGLEELAPLGRYRSWVPARPVVQWSWTKEER